MIGLLSERLQCWHRLVNLLISVSPAPFELITLPIMFVSWPIGLQKIIYSEERNKYTNM